MGLPISHQTSYLPSSSLRKSMTDSHFVFLKEFLRSFHTTGAVLPSGVLLAKRMVAPLDTLPGERRILEAGPGTGVFTNRILRCLQPGDRFLICEINPHFADHLRQKFRSDPLWRSKSEQVRIECADIRDFLEPSHYDLIVSGLPLNNFSPEFVHELLTLYLRSLKTGGVHTFFEYQAIRTVRRWIGSKPTRTRMKGIQDEIDALSKQAHVVRHRVFLNLPPAYAYEVRLHAEY